MVEHPSVSELVSIVEAAEIQGVSYQAIQDLMDRGELSSYKVGGRRLLSRKEVESYKPEPRTVSPPKEKQ